LQIPFGILCHSEQDMQDGLNVEVRENLDTVGDRLRSARKARSLKQGELAKLSGVGQSVISKLETGNLVRGSHVPRLAEALRVHVRWLDTGEGPRELPLGVREEMASYNFDAALESAMLDALRQLPPKEREVAVADVKARADAFQANLREYLQERAPHTTEVTAPQKAPSQKRPGART
jgi:transcriptional regulator with XRE-family HTH domain